MLILLKGGDKFLSEREKGLKVKMIINFKLIVRERIVIIEIFKMIILDVCRRGRINYLELESEGFFEGKF